MKQTFKTKKNVLFFFSQVFVSQRQPGAPRGQDRKHHSGNTASHGRGTHAHTHTPTQTWTCALHLWCDVQMDLVRFQWVVEAYWRLREMRARLNCLSGHRRYAVTCCDIVITHIHGHRLCVRDYMTTIPLLLRWTLGPCNADQREVQADRRPILQDRWVDRAASRCATCTTSSHRRRW